MFDLRQPSPGVYRIYDRANGNLLQDHLCQHAAPPKIAIVSSPDPVQATIDPQFCQRLPNTYRQVWRILLWGHCSSSLSPGAHKCLFVPSKICFPSPVEVLLSNPTELKSQIPWGFMSLCQIHRLRSLNWVLDPSQQCEKFFGKIAVQLVGHKHGGCMVGLIATSSKRAYDTRTPLHNCCSQCPHPCTRPLVTHTLRGDLSRQVWLSLLWGPLLFSLHPNEHKILFVPSKYFWKIWGLILT